MEGQLSFFDEADAAYGESVPEPDPEDVLPQKHGKKKKGQRDPDLKDFLEETIPPYSVSEKRPDAFYGKDNWCRMPGETYAGTDSGHQDEFMRGDRPKDLLRNSIVTPSLLASILNVKYVNSSALNRIGQEFGRNGVNISRQTMSNWITRCADKYFRPFVARMKQEILSLPVTQADETPTQVIGDSDHPNSKCYMWVHRSGELYKDRQTVIYEYQKCLDHRMPLAFYKDYKGILVTDSLEQYHPVNKKLTGVTNANCWARARRSFADAIKAVDKRDPNAVKQSVAYQALQKIAGFYTIDTGLKEPPQGASSKPAGTGQAAG